MIDKDISQLPGLEIPQLKFHTIPHTVYENTVAAIKFCVRATKKYGEPQGVPIEAVTAYGKTRLAEQQIIDRPHYILNGQLRIPVWLVRVPSKATPLELIQYMLYCLGEKPEKITDHQPSMITLLAERIREYVEDYVILDDIHYLLNVHTKAGRTEIAQVLADIIKRSKTTFVILGIHNTIDRVLKEDPQLKRLFRSTIVLQPLQLGGISHHVDETSKEFIAQLREFAAFTSKAEFTIGVKLPGTTDGEKLELLRRIHYITDGVVGHIINLLIFAEGISFDKQSEPIIIGNQKLLPADLNILSQAFVDKLKSSARKEDDTKFLLEKEDPFEIPLSKRFMPTYLK